MRPSLANLPFLRSTHSSMYLFMTFSRGFCHDQHLFDVMRSCSAAGAAGFCPTWINSSAFFRALEQRDARGWRRIREGARGSDRWLAEGGEGEVKDRRGDAGKRPTASDGLVFVQGLGENHAGGSFDNQGRILFLT